MTYAAGLILLSLVFARVGGLTMTAPIFGGATVPMQVRVLLAVALTALVAPLQWGAAVVSPGSLPDYAVLLGCEAVVGVCLGLGVLVLVHGMTLAGQLIGAASGLTVADVFDPSLNEDVPLFSRLFFLLAVAIFFCVGGHRMVLEGLLDTFKTIPPGGATFSRSIVDGFVTLAGQSFALAVRASAPVVMALLLATLTLGLVGRTLPQLNVLSLGFGVNAMLAFAALSLTLGVAAIAFADQIAPALETLLESLIP
ncbi:MAG: flagellar biosynthetic protein FliR [Planctomycetaceae bacterium]|nr:flagellar biosynthetic protein FliR [Planctomycetaceae bacterium]